jgi:hypothetical protein
MKWLTRWLGIHHDPQQEAARRARTRLQLEGLEERCLPTVTYHGGALLTHVEAQAVFYGNGWNSTPYTSQAGTLNSFVNYVVQSPFLEALTRAGYGVGQGTATTGVTDPANLSSGTKITDATIQKEVQSLISAGTVASPDTNRLYVLFVQPNVVVSLGRGLTSQTGLLGYHGAFAGHTTTGQAADIHYAVIAYPGGAVRNGSLSASPVDDMTAVASHEIAESITDPNVNYKTPGWYDSRRGEIGDITQQYLTHLNGYLVQQIAGQNDRPLSLTSFIGLPGTSTSLSASATQVHIGQTVTFTITVGPVSGTGNPTGTVTLLNGNQILGNATLKVVKGAVVATLTTTRLSAGTHTLTAIYAGDNSFQDSTSGTITVTVG